MLRAGSLVLIAGLSATATTTPTETSTNDTTATSVEASTPDTTTSPAATSSEATASGSPVSFGTELITDELQIPRELIDLGDGRMLIADQIGVIHLFVDGVRQPEPFLDLSDGIFPPSSGAPEAGLGGVALAPDFATSGLLYTFHTATAADDAPAGTVRTDTLTEWTVADDGTAVDPASGRVLLEYPQNTISHVGEIMFDDDGLLYIGFGAKTGSDTAQDPLSLDGTIARIDPAGGDPYAIPSDNPFADGVDGAPEVFAYGYRNPFRMEWDTELGLVVAEPMFTEKDQQVGVAQAGGNHGYPFLQDALSAKTCWVDGALEAACQTAPDGGAFVPPVLEYGREIGTIISGAEPVHGTALGDLDGHVLVSDWDGSLVVATPGTEPWSFEEVEVAYPDDRVPGKLWAMESDEAGNIYLMFSGTAAKPGLVLRLTR